MRLTWLPDAIRDAGLTVVTLDEGRRHRRRGREPFVRWSTEEPYIT